MSREIAITPAQRLQAQINFIKAESELYRMLVNDEKINCPFVLQLLSIRCDSSSESERRPRYWLVMSDCFFYYENFVVDNQTLCSAMQRHEFDCYSLIKVSNYLKGEIAGQVVIHLLEIERVAAGDNLGKEFGFLVEIPSIEISMDSLFDTDTLGSDNARQGENVVLDNSIDGADGSEFDEHSDSSELICDHCLGEHHNSDCPNNEEESDTDSHHEPIQSQASSLNTITIGSSSPSDFHDSQSFQSDLDTSQPVSGGSSQSSLGLSESGGVLHESEPANDSMDAYFDDSLDQILADSLLRSNEEDTGS